MEVVPEYYLSPDVSQSDPEMYMDFIRGTRLRLHSEFLNSDETDEGMKVSLLSRQEEICCNAKFSDRQTPTIPEVPYIPVQELNGVNQGFNHTINFNDVSGAETANQLQPFISPSISSTSAFNTHPVANVDNVSSVVNMLKGALEQKKLGNQENKETLEGSSFSFYNSQEIPVNISADQNGVNQTPEPPRTFRGVFPVQFQDLLIWQPSKGLWN
ncbi:uncharacterized protein A4U43_C08F760 [Asparagus officinalis]|nr:uncharacterized protein A4U43_C08F760 [Asparagus officinalis]